MGRRVERFRRTWGEVQFWSAVEEVGERSDWSLRSDRHTLKVLRSGTVRGYQAGIGEESRETRTLRPGSVSLVPAGRLYRSTGIGERIAFSVLTLPERGEFAAVLDGRDAFVHQTVARLDEALAGGEERLGETLVQALRLHLESRYLKSRPSDRGLEASERRRLEAYLEANLQARPTVDDLARLLDMGRNRFAASFQDSYGTSPARYVRELRLRRARVRLEAGVPDLTELAFDLGFASHSHLTAAFKAHYGVPPRELRRP